jgi:hypothetical protein
LAVRGRQAERDHPELHGSLQSNPSGVPPPNLYFVPICARAIELLNAQPLGGVADRREGPGLERPDSIVLASCAIAGATDVDANAIATSATFIRAKRFGDDGFMAGWRKSLVSLPRGHIQSAVRN